MFRLQQFFFHLPKFERRQKNVIAKKNFFSSDKKNGQTGICFIALTVERSRAIASCMPWRLLKRKKKKETNLNCLSIIRSCSIVIQLWVESLKKVAANIQCVCCLPESDRFDAKNSFSQSTLGFVLCFPSHTRLQRRQYTRLLQRLYLQLQLWQSVQREQKSN